MSTTEDHKIANALPARVPLLLSFDIENWHQLSYQYFDAKPTNGYLRASLYRQVSTLLEILEALKATATFFLLGKSIATCPEIVSEIANNGHEIACHGYQHRPVTQQSPDEFRRDVEEALDVILKVSPNRPIGYRAPLFSINRDCVWAYDILSDLGFSYDSSIYDSPKIPNRIRPIPSQPFRLGLPSGKVIVEFPISTLRIGGWKLPIGGGTYWRVLPRIVLRRAFRRLVTGNPTTNHVLYFHPYEFDPLPLRIHLPPNVTSKQRLLSTYLVARYAIGRRSLSAKLRDMSHFFSFTAIHNVLNSPQFEDTLLQVRFSTDGNLQTRSI